jgi:hypothetical protein
MTDMQKIITDDLRDAYREDVVISHIIQHGPGTVVLYQVRKTNQYRVALYNRNGEPMFDLVVDEDD